MTAWSDVSSRRVVITGVGAVTPLAADAESSWKRMVAGESAIVCIPDAELRSKCASKVGGFVPSDGSYAFDPLKYIEERELRKISLFTRYAIAAAHQALDDAGLLSSGELASDKRRTGVYVGSGIGGLETLESSVIKIRDTGRSLPTFIPSILINLAAGNIAIRYKTEGCISAPCSACASGLQAIADAAKEILLDNADVIIAGGAESAMCESAFAGFHGCRALSTSFNDSPATASRPWDGDRDGFVMAEGAGILIMEEYEHAKRRGANIYAEVVGAGIRADNHSVTAPNPEGIGAYSAMRDAMAAAQIDIDSIDYAKAHATSTPTGDDIELMAVSRLFGNKSEQLLMSSMKSSIGHTLGASGGIETAFAVLAMRDGIVPPTLNLSKPTSSSNVDLVPLVAREKTMKAVISNAFGFGGVNVSVVIRSV